MEGFVMHLAQILNPTPAEVKDRGGNVDVLGNIIIIMQFFQAVLQNAIDCIAHNIEISFWDWTTK